MSTVEATAPAAQSTQILDSIRQRATNIHHRLDRLVTAAALKAGWSRSDVPRMLHEATVEFYRRLSQHEAPETALEKAMECAERAQIIRFIEEAGQRGHPLQAAMLVILQRRLNSDVALERKAIQFALATFNAMLQGGHTIAAAVDAARESAVSTMQTA